MINILIRTSNRPLFFYKCINSILNQNYLDYKIYVHVDDEFTKGYVNKYKGVIGNIVESERIERKGHLHCPYNLYMNKLLDCVEDGYILFLDDDNYLGDIYCLSELSNYLNNVDTLYLFKVKMQSGRIIPEDEFFCGQPTRKHIDTSCFCFNYKYKNERWDDMRAGDFRFVSKLYEVIPNKERIDKYFVKMGNNGVNGDLKDMQNER